MYMTDSGTDQRRKTGREILIQKLEWEFVIVAILIVAGGFIFKQVEGWRFFDSIYYTVTVMAAIGLGDFVPKTDLGKFFTIIYAFTGVPLLAYTASILIQKRFDE
jgi:hypothetical protein